MILNKEELNELELEIEKCTEKLEMLRKTKIRHYVKETISNRFGCLLEDVGILMDKNGVKYVLSNLNDQIEYNYDNQRYYGHTVHIIAKTIVKTKDTLSKTNRIIYDLKGVYRIGEQYNG